MPNPKPLSEQAAEKVYEQAMNGYEHAFDTEKAAEIIASTYAEQDRLVGDFIRAVSVFGARVKERCPSWFKEEPGSTDFADAKAQMEAAASRLRAERGE